MALNLKNWSGGFTEFKHVISANWPEFRIAFCINQYKESELIFNLDKEQILVLTIFLEIFSHR